MTTEVGSPDIAATSSTRRFYVYSAVVAIAATIAVFGKVILYMVDHWKTVPDYSHGFVVAPLALYFAWERRRQLARARIAPSWWGVVPLALGGLAYAIGRLGVELMSMRVGFVLTLMGMVLLLLGRSVFRILLFPLCFLFLMVPLPGSLLNIIAFPLQLVAADLAVTTLQLFGMPVLREGNIIHLPETQLFVAEACSGLRSLMALGTLGVVFAYFFRKTWGERLVLVLSTLPIAVLVNAFRVMLTAFLTHRFGQGMVDGVIHQTEGFFTFALAFGLLLLEARLLAWLWPRARTPRATEVAA